MAQVSSAELKIYTDDFNAEATGLETIGREQLSRLLSKQLGRDVTQNQIDQVSAAFVDPEKILLHQYLSFILGTGWGLSDTWQRRALLIAAWDDACENPNPILASAGNIRLKSFLNDVSNVKDFLLNCGFQKEHIAELHASKATTVKDAEDMFKALQQECSCAAPDKKFFIVVHYSGHGTFVVDLDDDELDPVEAKKKPAFSRWKVRKPTSKDEVLAIHENAKIKDDDLHALLDFGENTNAMCILDCCHSGTLADLMYNYVEDANGSLQPQRARKEGSERKQLHRVISLSGCSDQQESKMSSLEGETVGNLTKALLQRWRMPGGLRMPMFGDGQFFKEVKAKVKEQTNSAQTPHLCASFEMPRTAMPMDPESWC